MPSFADLLSDSTIVEIVDAILDNNEFKNECITKLKTIFEDGRIDNHDIPNIVLLLMLIYNNNHDIKISKENFKKVFKLLLHRLLDELNFYDGISDSDREMLEIAVDTSLTLLMAKVEFEGTLKKLKSKLCCCGKKKNNAEEIATEIERTINKKREISKNVGDAGVGVGSA